MIPGDLLSASPHRLFHTLPGLLDSWAALPNSNPKAAFPLMRFSSRAAAVRLGSFFATMHFQWSVSIDAVSRTMKMHYSETAPQPQGLKNASMETHPNACMPIQGGSSSCTIFMMVFGMTRPRGEPTTYRARGGHATD